LPVYDTKDPVEQPGTSGRAVSYLHTLPEGAQRKSRRQHQPIGALRFMGHSKVTTTLSVYAHLFEDDHADAMAALGAMGQPVERGDNVVPIRREG